MKQLFSAARSHPVRLFYILAAAGLVLSLLLNFLLDAVLYATGILTPQTITLDDTSYYELVNVERTGDDTLQSLSGDAQLLLYPGQYVRTLTVYAEYDTDLPQERDLYWHLPGRGYTSALRVWPAPNEDNTGWSYVLPRLAGKNLRLDIADTAPVTIKIQAIVLNARPVWYTYFIPSPVQLFLTAAVPGLLACLAALLRPARAAAPEPSQERN